MKKYDIYIEYLDFKCRTPENIFTILNDKFNFDYIPSTDSSLCSDWIGKIYLCPEYHAQKTFLSKGLSELKKGNSTLLVCLLPCRTDTLIFHNLILPNAVDLHFIRGRLKFQGFKYSAPFPSMLVAFDSKSLGKFASELKSFEIVKNGWEQKRNRISGGEYPIKKVYKNEE